MTWVEELRQNITEIEELEKYIPLSPEEKERLEEVIQAHPMSISRYYLSLIDPNDPDDPIRKMAVPSVKELDLAGEYDTSGESQNTKLPGLQHKYAQTALILATNACAMYCRHCFRKRLVGIPTKETIERLDGAVEYIREHKEINNVLVSGGDPFLLPTEVIEEFLYKLTDIPHVDFVRFGTRTPVTFPDRILMDPELPEVLQKYSTRDRRVYIVTQFNHPREITDKSTRAVDALIKANTIISNQTVLLKGVNDSGKVLAELMNVINRIGVIPYYIFQCRPVKRVKSHFQVPLYDGYWIVEEAKKYLNGHTKRIRYIMSHVTGKIEIIGVMDGYMYFKYHQAKDPSNLGKMFRKKVSKTAAWLDDFEE
ncbi:L-lysine 2,3-aminomutase [Archaeoglobus sulfaticallidus PM70-1]|uniref:L-lysine 2,3-aminomutase n=1 Tax=Archaeoglobus sulfaticallidus PM70-1 TaxID=387631 RepID=N0BCV8_9EURY|nr:KamA family radical SAM protein [Archaeoglobus sulfaticallidus]AGK60052.1 L-lysine 2,3-aminomutase [Archaeoglobus sulfaticallidus PM70-1]